MRPPMETELKAKALLMLQHALDKNQGLLLVNLLVSVVSFLVLVTVLIKLFWLR